MNRFDSRLNTLEKRLPPEEPEAEQAEPLTEAEQALAFRLMEELDPAGRFYAWNELLCHYRTSSQTLSHVLDYLEAVGVMELVAGRGYRIALNGIEDFWQQTITNHQVKHKRRVEPVYAGDEKREYDTLEEALPHLAGWLCEHNTAYTLALHITENGYDPEEITYTPKEVYDAAQSWVWRSVLCKHPGNAHEGATLRSRMCRDLLEPIEALKRRIEEEEPQPN